MSVIWENLKLKTNYVLCVILGSLPDWSITAWAVCLHRHIHIADINSSTTDAKYPEHKWKGDAFVKTSTLVMLIAELLLLTGLTKLPVAAHLNADVIHFCLGLQLQRAVFFSVWAGVPQGSVFGPYVKWNTWMPWYSCMIAGWVEAESQRIDRGMEVGMGGTDVKTDGRGLLFLQPIACGYCAITVGLVWVLYYCNIWRIVIYCIWKERFYPLLILLSGIII